MSVAVGFLYIAAQAAASATAGKNSKTESIRWWFHSDGAELLFFLLMLSAVLHFVVNAGGGSKMKYWYVLVPAIVLVSAILVGVAPVVYQQVHNDAEIVKFDRRGCNSAKEVDKKFGLLVVCPSIQSDHFIRYDFNNRSTEEIRVITDGLGTLNSLASTNSLEKAKSLDPRLSSFLANKCFHSLSDAICADVYREVRLVWLVLVAVCSFLIILLFDFFFNSATQKTAPFLPAVAFKRVSLLCCMTGKTAGKKHVRLTQIGVPLSMIR